MAPRVGAALEPQPVPFTPVERHHAGFTAGSGAAYPPMLPHKLPRNTVRACGVNCGAPMARAINRLTARTVAAMTRPGRHADGGGLYLIVDKCDLTVDKPAPAKRWALLVSVRGKRREIGLGGVTSTNGLAEARKSAAEALRAIERGDDPTRPKVAAPAFRIAAEQVIKDLAPGWRGAKTEDGWRRNLLTHAADIGSVPVDLITTEDVLSVVRPLWTSKPESGGKLRARIEVVLDAAKARGWREGDNPARWRGHLDRLLPKPKKLIRGHHKALPYAKIPDFMAALAEQTSSSARALEWTILTASREDMTLNALWGEIEGDIWTIPGSRMKMAQDLRVPLPAAALAVLEAVKIGEPRPEALIFPGKKKGRPMSNATMDALLDRMGVPVTVHGFRSTFRDWAGDMTEHPREVAEAALAHAVGNAVERSYRRGDALEKRRALMADWAAYCRPAGAQPPGGVETIKP